MKRRSLILTGLLAVSIAAGVPLLLPGSDAFAQQGTGSGATAVVAAMPPPQPPPPRLMAKWEEANAPYKRALQATSIGNGMEGQAFLAHFRRAWDAFQAMFADNPPPPFARDAKRWHADLHDIGALVDTADRHLAVGQTHEAHETLEQVRLRWLALRARYGVETFGDHLTRFHDPMERVALAVKGKTAQTIAEKDIATVREAVPDLRRLLAPIEKAKPEGLTAEGARERRQYVAALAQAVTALEQALASGDKSAIVAAGASIKPLFARLYMGFG